MDKDDRKPTTRRFSRWFGGKYKRNDLYNLNEPSGKSVKLEDKYKDEDDSVDDLHYKLSEEDPCTSTNVLRVFVGTWNVAGRSPIGSLAVDLDEWLNLKEAADIYVLGFQEIVPLITKNVIGSEDTTEATNWNLLISQTLNDRHGNPWLTPMLNPATSENYQYEFLERVFVTSAEPSHVIGQPHNQDRDQYASSMYKLIASKKMVGVFVSVWMKSALVNKYCISSVKVSSVACGIMGYLGNKGSVSVSMTIEGTNICFIAAHLASGEKKGDEGKRNYQVSEIFRRTAFSRVPRDGDRNHPLTILGHDRIFWFGDLNYRLYLKDELARKLIEEKNWTALQEFDQLKKELEEGGVFEGWKEGNIEFAPTYKYSTSNCNRYSGGLPSRAGEKQRTPAWCDRILWYGKGVKQLSYIRSESKFSDHRPVSALFSTHIEVLKFSDPSKFPP
ncbi:type I inositol polyphosphate 5-phosphatase 4-like isoform X2 [Apium graveolens]|uniref:type I inositol polyphosphate 5-phosphatase 4-like isoform X2 n=1 Tax=Apium graveolens TaxID=4045 RepID=UPI003D79D3DE